MRTLALGLVLAVFAQAAGAAVPSISPAASSDAILAAHPNPEGELRARYSQDDGRHSEALSIALAQDYDYLETPDLRTVHDYRTRRILRFQPAFIASYRNDSLYAEVWRRGAEVQRRATEAGHVPQAGVGAVKGQLNLAPFWAESELGIIAPSYPRPLGLKREENGDRTRWTLDGQEVAAVRWHSDPVPDQLKKSLRRFWPGFAPVHPVIADELAASGRLPEELWVQGLDPERKHLIHMHWKLVSTEWAASAPFPLPPRLQAGPSESAGVFPEIFATLVSAVQRRLQPPPESVYLAKMQAAISGGDGLQAVLWQRELILAAGPPPPECLKGDHRPLCTLGEAASGLADGDDRTQMAFAPQSPALKERAAFADLPNGYLLRLLWALRPPGQKVTFAESERGVLDALKASPVANFAKDAGDFYAAAWKERAAWQVWDLGRLMAGHRQGDLLTQIDVLEERLASSYPEFF